MDGGIADEAAHGAFLAEDLQAAAARGGDIRPADPIDAEKALLGDVLDDEADLVRVGLHHELRGLGAAPSSVAQALP